jgi:hypothetical protein
MLGLLHHNDICIPISSVGAIIFRAIHTDCETISHEQPVNNIITLTEKCVRDYNCFQYLQGYRFVYGDRASLGHIKHMEKITGIDISKPHWYEGMFSK